MIIKNGVCHQTFTHGVRIREKHFVFVKTFSSVWFFLPETLTNIAQTVTWPCISKFFENLAYTRILRDVKPIATSKVAIDLENLEKSGNLNETSESQGICLKSQGICDRIPKVKEFCCLKFIFSHVEDPRLKNFLREHAPDPPKWSWTHGRA